LEIAARGKTGEMPALQNAKSTANSGCATANFWVLPRETPPYWRSTATATALPPPRH